MRKWHRWITVVIGLFMPFIALTGVGSHLAAMYARGSIFESETRAGPPPGAPPVAVAVAQGPGAAAGAAPAPATGRPPAIDPARRLVGLLHHLHSGEFFGPTGVIISLLAGFALIFFAVSGMWMYVQMYLNRRGRGRDEIFWK